MTSARLRSAATDDRSVDREPETGVVALPEVRRTAAADAEPDLDLVMDELRGRWMQPDRSYLVSFLISFPGDDDRGADPAAADARAEGWSAAHYCDGEGLTVQLSWEAPVTPEALDEGRRYVR